VFRKLDHGRIALTIEEISWKICHPRTIWPDPSSS
jgi:hypothetical protein